MMYNELGTLPPFKITVATFFLDTMDLHTKMCLDTSIFTQSRDTYFETKVVKTNLYVTLAQNCLSKQMMIQR
jgi:hypothetical protein